MMISNGLTLGGVVLILSNAEIEVLALCAWCKDLPIEQSKNIPAEIIDMLLYFGFIRPSRNKLGYRCTPEGFKLLYKAEINYEPDKTYRSDSDVLERRMQTAKITSFFWRYGANVFIDTPAAEMVENVFLPSFALRRQKHANILGGTKLTGFYYGRDVVFIPYFITKESTGLYPDVEQRTFRAETLLRGRKPYVIYTGDGELSDIIDNVFYCKEKSNKTTTDYYSDAIDKFNCQVALVPLDNNGMKLLRILEISDYRQRLAKNILGKNYISSSSKLYDGKSKLGNLIIGIDCNIKRFGEAITDKELTNIMILPFQAEALSKLFAGKNVIFHTLNITTVENLLGIPNELPLINNLPYQNGKGENIYVPFIRKGKKDRR